jgi:very-short-patch-repair endonuclease
MIDDDIVESALDLLPRSSKRYSFKCPDCKHIFPASMGSMYDGKECPFCDNCRLCEDEDCKSCHEKSFASVYESKFWSKDNKKTPRQCFKGSRQMGYFDCIFCGKPYSAQLASVTFGSWCSCIKNKTEKKLRDYLEAAYDIPIGFQAKFEWCKNIRLLPFDFLLKVYRIIIELDGRQHFMNVFKDKDYRLTQQRDRYKMECANKHGYSVIRILQHDVLYDKNNWQADLDIAINLVKNQKDPFNILIGDIYLEHDAYKFNYTYL